MKTTYIFLVNRPDALSGKTSVSGAGGMGFKFRADQISYTLPTTRHHCNIDVWALTQSRGDGHRSLVTPERVLSEYNKDLIFYIPRYKNKPAATQHQISRCRYLEFYPQRNTKTIATKTFKRKLKCYFDEVYD